MRTGEVMNDEKSSGFRREVGKRIRQIREEKGMSRDRLAEKADITIKFMYELETGKKGLSAKTLQKIAKALSCSCDYILLGIDRVEEACDVSQFNLGLYKEYSERECELMMEIIQLILELKEERRG